MRILHTSDWHLGQNFMGKSREEEHSYFFDWLYGVVSSEGIDVLVVSGDIFDTGTPPNYALELYYNLLTKLSNIPNLHIIITAGNHDSISTLKAPKQLLKALNIHVITSGDEDENIIIPIYKNSNLDGIVCAVPFLRDSIIRQSLSGQTISQKEKVANSGIKTYYENVHKKALELKQDKNIPIIAMGHLTTVGSRSSQSERDIYIGGTIDIGGDYLASMFDYVALGHLHINQIVGNNEHVRYSGSPLPLSFSESKNIQKINLVTFEEDKINIEELEIPLFRKLVVIKGNYEHIKNELSKIEDKTAWIEVHISDDNAMYVNNEIRQLASKLDLTLLAVKIDKSEKQLIANDLKVISLDELSVEQVFEKRLALEEVEDKEFEKELLLNLKEVVSKVQTL
jgi:exonuclease SbcD